MRDYFDQHGITLANIPALFMEAFYALPAPRSLRLLTSGGDAQRSFQASPYAVFNEYGPSEATVMCTCQPVLENSARIPIGKAIAGAWCLVLDRGGRVQPFGTAGELHISGPGLARGYLQRPEETAVAFVANAYAAALPETGGNPAYQRFYKSGDLCRMSPDGTLEFLGRLDTQISVRGHRVETAEIEHHLRAQADVSSALVTLRETHQGPLLTAYLVIAAATWEATVSACKTTLAERLPSYMLPDAYVRLDAFPLTANGKVDLQALPLPEAVTGGQGAPAKRALELALAGLWQETLQVASIGMDDDFFALGGDSLKAVRLVAAVETLTGTRVSIVDFLRGRTVRAMLRQLEQSAGPTGKNSLLAPLRHGKGATLVLVPSLGGSLLCYKSLLDALPADVSIQALTPLNREVKADEQPETLSTMLAPYIEPLASAFPQGDVVLLGLCMAGLDAWEIAAQLAARGIFVRAVVSLNTRSSMLVDEKTGEALQGAALAEVLSGEVPNEAVADSLETMRHYEGLEAKTGEEVDAVLAAHLRAQLRAWGGYCPPPVRVPMICIRPEDAALADFQPFETRPLGWSETALGGARDIYVLGSHFSMLHAPHVNNIAAVLLPFLHEPAMGAVVPPLTPIQHWFFELPMRREHFFQSVTLRLHKARPLAQHQKVLTALTARHEMLRALYRSNPEGGDTIQFLAEGWDAAAFFGLHFCEAGRLDAARRGIAENLNLARGPLAWCLIEQTAEKAGAGQRLVFMLHHLIVDGVSWRILLQDFAAALACMDAGTPIVLPSEQLRRDGNFPAWATRLAEYASGPALRAAAEFWRQQPVLRPLPVKNRVTKRLKSDLQSHSLMLEADLSRRILTQARTAYQTGVDVVLLAALLEASRTILRSAECTVLLEGHGREELFDDVSPLGVLGWFTVMYPVPFFAGGDFAGTLEEVRQRLKQTAGQGMNYGLARYLGDATCRAGIERAADLTFNFLGDATGDENQPFALESLGSPLDMGDDFPQETPLSLTAYMQDEQIRLLLDWHPAEFDAANMAALLERTREILEQAFVTR
ncbi:hypothetical protein FACS189488_13420 [Betaproteobacteria bacterium]|nr:hypothetical protein FACS189488_13420 [Betaproteobacteria bacterium]